MNIVMYMGAQGSVLFMFYFAIKINFLVNSN